MPSDPDAVDRATLTVVADAHHTVDYAAAFSTRDAHATPVGHLFIRPRPRVVHDRITPA
ncbi:hypothetical protein [Halorubrum laminariae]|uniref:Uncharacterized protein n=1 Tax=Halorubrum laminariae TaxID=1433523 RepID=A0ABD6C0Q5_9EURY|nr:hypothetical protein [Halorubrum laminariae]